jgi:hypothetical protein
MTNCGTAERGNICNKITLQRSSFLSTAVLSHPYLCTVSSYGLDDGNIWVRLHEWLKILLLSTASRPDVQHAPPTHVTNTCCCTSQHSFVQSKCTFFPLHQSRLRKRALLRPSVLLIILEHRWNDTDMGNTRTETCHSTTLSTTNLTTNLGLNPGLR